MKAPFPFYKFKDSFNNIVLLDKFNDVKLLRVTKHLRILKHRNDSALIFFEILSKILYMININTVL